MSVAAPPVPVAVTWHDAECGGYAGDLQLWRELAEASGGPVLDLGAGSGRVALDLAERGCEVVAVDSERQLLDALDARAAERGLAVETVIADVRELALGRAFPLVLAPMQLLHMLGGATNRSRALREIRAHLQPGGIFASAILAEPLPPSGPAQPLPDVREVGGWIHSSLPIEVRVSECEIEIVRLRQLVAPDGELNEELDVTTVDRLPPRLVEDEAAEAGLRITGSQPIPETDEHVASVALLMEAGDG